MKFLIVTYDDYINIPYIAYYENNLRARGIPYDIVLWNRSGRTDKNPPNSYVFTATDYSAKWKKIIPFFRWRRFVLRLLRKNRYDWLIILTTIPGILLADKLLGRYRKRYWLDIRDYTYEKFLLYKELVGRLTKGSFATSISSEAFLSFLPDDSSCVLTHNITNYAAKVPSCTLDIEKRPITIGFVGGIQFVEQNKRLLTLFRNNPAYCIEYVGRTHPGCDLQSFCNENQVQNVRFLPAYDNASKPGIYQSIDLINSIYGADNEVVRLALPNKLYDCILFKKPILVSKGTYLAQLVEQYQLGLAVDIETDPVVEMADAYLNHFNQEAFERGCQMLLDKVMQEQTDFENALDQFLMESMRKAGYELEAVAAHSEKTM